jgi:hypothetical protein
MPLPPYSPDQTPIEELVSKVKNAILAIAVRTIRAVYEAFEAGLHEVTLEDRAGWFGDRAAHATQLSAALQRFADGLRTVSQGQRRPLFRPPGTFSPLAAGRRGRCPPRPRETAVATARAIALAPQGGERVGVMGPPLTQPIR